MATNFILLVSCDFYKIAANSYLKNKGNNNCGSYEHPHFLRQDLQIDYSSFLFSHLNKINGDFKNQKKKKKQSKKKGKETKKSGE